MGMPDKPGDKLGNTRTLYRSFSLVDVKLWFGSHSSQCMYEHDGVAITMTHAPLSTFHSVPTKILICQRGAMSIWGSRISGRRSWGVVIMVVISPSRSCYTICKQHKAWALEPSKGMSSDHKFSPSRLPNSFSFSSLSSTSLYILFTKPRPLPTTSPSFNRSSHSFDYGLLIIDIIRSHYHRLISILRRTHTHINI